MRMRHKKNLGPRMERTKSSQILQPEENKGKWLEIYPDYHEIRAEIGCGKGRFTIGTAKENPDSLILGIEKVKDAMVIGMERVCADNVPNVFFLDFEALNLKEIFSPGEVSVIYINFPDPWPKTRAAKHRLTSPEFLPLYWDVLKPGGRIEFKTDQKFLFDYSLETFEAGGYLLSEISYDIHADGPVGIMTDYEARFHEQGIPICRCVARKPL